MSIRSTLQAAGLLLGAVCSGHLAAQAGDLTYGEYLASECVTCHQRSGQAHGIPAIVGWPQDQFVAVLNSYRWKERANPVMQTIAGKLSDEDIDALATYFETLDPTKKTVQARHNP